MLRPIAIRRFRTTELAALLAVWLLAAYGIWAWGDQRYADAIIAVSVGHTLFGAYVFMHHGRHRITASGTYFLASAIFVGLAGLGVAAYRSQSLDDALAATCIVSLLSNTTVYVLFARSTASLRTIAPANKTPSQTSGRAVQKVGWLGVVLVGAGAGIQLVLPALKPLTMSAAYSGCVVILLAFVERWGVRSLVASRRWLIVSALAIAFFLSVFFSGGGRLNVATIGISVGLMVTSMRPRAWYKWAFLLGALPATVLGGYLRAGAARGVDVDIGSVVLEQGHGLGSVWGPVDTFADIVRHRRLQPKSIPLQYGSTIWEAVVAPFPRAWWPGKPEGLGLRLTRWLMPAYADVGHSLAATAYGEWYLNFGWYGLPVGILVIGSAIVLLDRAWLGALGKRNDDLSSLLTVAFWTVLIAGLADYVWVGFFTYNTRAGIRGFVILVVLIGLRLLSRRRWRHSTERLAMAASRNANSTIVGE